MKASSRSSSVSHEILYVYMFTHVIWYTVTWDVILRRIRATSASPENLTRVYFR